MTIVHGASNNAAAYASDCAWFPVEYPSTPAARWSGVIESSSVIPPRTLNAPVGCVCSCLTNVVAPVVWFNAGYDHIGVGVRCRASTPRARRTSVIVGSRMPEPWQPGPDSER